MEPTGAWRHEGVVTVSSEIRQQRVAELLFEELTIMVASELSDPRISLAEVIRVDISKDLRNAKVFVHHADEEVSRRDLLKGLEHATPWLRGQLAIRCGLRVVPELLFVYDDSPERAARIDELLRQIASERAKGPPQDGGQTAA
jgi:ribosome-binding factor A